MAAIKGTTAPKLTISAIELSNVKKKCRELEEVSKTSSHRDDKLKNSPKLSHQFSNVLEILTSPPPLPANMEMIRGA